MVSKAAVKIFDNTQHKEIIVPCHRHADAFEILKLFNINYTEIAQGFLDENDNFLSRAEAWEEAMKCHQFLVSYIEEHYDDVMVSTVLYSEDVW